MLNRNIPIYEGNLPYLYVCYSPEDETLVLPVLGRMYNEGFRLWSACLAGKVSDFISVRHVSTSACVMIFMSHNMRERINSGVPEVIAACRSSLLRTVVLLDDARPENSMFALTSPDSVEYQRSNDAPFWLYAYSADYLERCRGPWPETKVVMREPTYEEVSQESVASEYINLEKIINRGGSKMSKAQPQERFPNNRGYIAPKPDRLEYVPLEKVEAARTEHDRDYDAAMSLLSQCAEKQAEIIINHPRPGERTVPAMPSISPLKSLPDKQAEKEIIRQELNELPADRPERKVDPEVRKKADIVVVPEEKPEIQEAPVAETAPAETKEFDLTVSGIAASIARLASVQEENSVSEQPAAADEVSAQAEQAVTDSEVLVEVPETVAAEPAATEIAEQEQSVEENRSDDIVAANSSSGKSTVQVVVRRQQPAVRVTPVRKRVITETITAPETNQRRRPGLSRAPYGSRLRTPGAEETAAFEQYIRNIALEALASETDTAAAQTPVSHRRYGVRTANTAAAPAVVSVPAAPVVTAAPQEAPAAIRETAAEVAAAPTENAAEQEKTSARKNRYPHNSGALIGLLAALRRERAAAGAAPADESAEKAAAAAYEKSAEKQENVSEEGELKVIRLSDAISERRVSDLQAAVNKFMRIDNTGDPVPHIKVYGIRR